MLDGDEKTGSEDELTDVEKTAAAIMDANKAELESTEQVSGAGWGDDEDEQEFCKCFGLECCTDAQKAVIAKAKRLVEAGPTVAVAALMLGMTNPPD